MKRLELYTRDDENRIVYFDDAEVRASILSQISNIRYLSGDSLRMATETLIDTQRVFDSCFPMYLHLEVPNCKVTVTLDFESGYPVMDTKGVSTQLYQFYGDINWPASKFSLAKATTYMVLIQEAVSALAFLETMFCYPVGVVI